MNACVTNLVIYLVSRLVVWVFTTSTRYHRYRDHFDKWRVYLVNIYLEITLAHVKWSLQLVKETFIYCHNPVRFHNNVLNVVHTVKQAKYIPPGKINHLSRTISKSYFQTVSLPIKGQGLHFNTLPWLAPDDFTRRTDEPCPL